MDSMKDQVLELLNSRIDRLEQHQRDRKPDHGNEYENLNHSLSRVIGSSLKKELEDLRDCVQGLK